MLAQSITLRDKYSLLYCTALQRKHGARAARYVTYLDNATKMEYFYLRLLHPWDTRLAYSWYTCALMAKDPLAVLPLIKLELCGKKERIRRQET